jgi:hypothetical protein
MVSREETIDLMEPMLPEGQNAILADLAVALLDLPIFSGNLH